MSFVLKIVIFSLCLGLLVTIVLYILYSIRLKKEFSGRLSLEVDKALSNYYLDNMKMKEYNGVESNDSDIIERLEDLDQAESEE